MFHNVYFALDSIKRGLPVLQKQFWTGTAVMGENQKTGHVFQVKLNEFNVKYRFLIPCFDKKIHNVYFAVDTIIRYPPVPQK